MLNKILNKFKRRRFEVRKRSLRIKPDSPLRAASEVVHAQDQLPPRPLHLKHLRAHLFDGKRDLPLDHERFARVHVPHAPGCSARMSGCPLPPLRWTVKPTASSCAAFQCSYFSPATRDNSPWNRWIILATSAREHLILGPCATSSCFMCSV